ncbi:MAG: hypothetical protein ACRCUZ_01095, partial [Shewanella sp.]
TGHYPTQQTLVSMCSAGCKQKSVQYKGLARFRCLAQDKTYNLSHFVVITHHKNSVVKMCAMLVSGQNCR